MAAVCGWKKETGSTQVSKVKQIKGTNTRCQELSDEVNLPKAGVRNSKRRSCTDRLCCAQSLSGIQLLGTDCSPPGSSAHGDAPGKNTEVGCLALLQGIFSIQGSNPGLPHCRRILHRLSLHRSPYRQIKCALGLWELSTNKKIIFVLIKLNCKKPEEQNLRSRVLLTSCKYQGEIKEKLKMGLWTWVMGTNQQRE